MTFSEKAISEGDFGDSCWFFQVWQVEPEIHLRKEGFEQVAKLYHQKMVAILNYYQVV